LVDTTDALRTAGIPTIYIGGVAVIAHGVARDTSDIDFTVLAAQVTPEALLDALQKRGFEPRLSDALDFARRRQVLLVTHTRSGVSIDATLAW
jgi:hypothetical protein